MILRNKLNEGRPVLGAFLGLSVPALVQVIGHSGFDFVILDGEHGCFSPESLDACLGAAAAIDLPAVVRLPNSDSQYIQAALDAGAQGVQVPAVAEPDQARCIVAASHFPPRGRRGFGSTTRAAGFGFMPRTQVVGKAAEETLVIVQIETRAGIENLSEILAVDGIDIAFLGTNDLSLDYGYASPSDPAMLPLLKSAIGAIRRSGKQCGIHITDLKFVPPMADLGVSYFTVASLALVGRLLQDTCEEFQNLFPPSGASVLRRS